MISNINIRLTRNKNKIKSINNIAFPLMVNMVSGILMGLVGQAMIGRISLDAYGAVGLIDNTLYSVTGVLGMIAIAFNIHGAQSLGRNDENEFLNLFSLGMYVSIFIGILFFLISILFGTHILQHLFGIKGRVLKEALDYLNIFSLSVGLNMILFMFSAYLKVKNKTKYIFYGNTISSILNIMFSYVLIFGKCGFPQMGVTGAAIASVLSLSLNVLIYIFVVRIDKPLKLYNTNFKNIKKLHITALPLMGQEFLESTVITIGINSILGRLGILELSAYTLIFQIINFALMPMYAYSSASLTLVGKGKGASDLFEINDIPKLCIIISFLFSLFIAIVVIIFRNKVPYIITDDVNLIKMSSSYIVIGIIANVFNLPATVYKYSLQGINDEMWVFLSSVALNLFSLGIIFILTLVFRMGLYGVYIGIFIDYLLLSVIFILRYNFSLGKYRKNNLSKKTEI
ncbi:MATE family efflux transporter [Thermoanaerobacter uzonensis]|nr:MATE family efflux transporter [Thermoanaerobacter uzonensis]